MKDWTALFPFDDYASAVEHLAQRSKRVRCDAPIGNGLRLVRDVVAPGTVSVVYHQTAIVTYEPDGTQVLDWGGWFTKTTFDHIETFAHLRDVPHGDFVFRPYNRRRNGHGDGVEMWRKSASWPKSPARVRKCRACKGTGQSGQDVTDWHDGTCYRCKGAQTVDYGSKPETEVWDSSFQVVIDPDGTYDVRWGIPLPTYDCTCSLCRCGCRNWQHHHAHHVVPNKPQPAHPHAASGKHVMGAEVGNVLARVLPGLGDQVNCPHCEPIEGVHTGTVLDVVVHLNDVHRVTREEVADWLDTLDVDLRFPTPA